MKKFILLLVVLCSCTTQRVKDCERYMSTLEVGQVLEKDFEHLYLKTKGVTYSTYVVFNGYANEVIIKTKNDTIINLNFRIRRRR